MSHSSIAPCRRAPPGIRPATVGLLGASLQWLIVGCTGPVQDNPEGLPFTVPRRDVGRPVPPEDTTLATAKVASFLRDVGYFEWALSVSHGVHASTGKPSYAVWWQDVEAVKQGAKVTFRHATGGAHNLYIPTSKILTAAAAGYRLTGDRAMAEIVKQYSRGMAAACRGLVYDGDDPDRFVLARNIVTQNHAYRLPDGRQKAVDYSGWYSPYEAWNAHRFRFERNPFWGDIWVTNMRSKDDLPHMFFAAGFLRYVPDQGEVAEAAREGLDCLQGAAKDIVDSGYQIRTKDARGRPYVPAEDLASFVKYERLVPNAECSAKISAAFLGYGDARANDCERNDDNGYERIATAGHYYNYAIIQTFHLSAVLGALTAGDHARARRLLIDLGRRVDRYMDATQFEPGRDDGRWNADLAAYLLQSSAVGLPLKADEVRLIQAQFAHAVQAYAAWTNWNVWALPDGTYGFDGGYLPSDEGGRIVAIEELGLLLAY